MSVDYRPYLLETDLRTAEDVLEWLYRSQRDETPVEDARLELNRRLDRERRQACRRGALRAWRRASATMRASTSTRGYDRPRAMVFAVWVDRWPPSLVKKMLANLAEALSFRAAARGK
jgi:hypothetical protein